MQAVDTKKYPEGYKKVSFIFSKIWPIFGGIFEFKTKMLHKGV